MLSYLQGKLLESHPRYIIVGVMGLGIQVVIPPSFYFELPAQGEEIVLYTYLQLKDEEPVLYGFRTREEKDFFLMLRGVSGIGPKVALALLGHLSCSQLRRAIVEDDVNALTCVPGIGGKTAKRLVYELSEKMLGRAEEVPAFLKTPETGGDSWTDVQQALLGLGYSPQEVARVRKTLGEKKNTGLEVLFREALNFLSGGQS